MSTHPGLAAWHTYMADGGDPRALHDLLAEDAIFHSPVVHTPQEGKAITMMYLGAAGQTLGGDSFRYTRVFDCGERAVLEFETVMDGVSVNGIDMIEWDEDGLITDFKVMVRPLKAINLVHQKMAEMLTRSAWN